jgi:hypothetical protein
LVKATDFDSVMRRFESYLPSQTVDSGALTVDGRYRSRIESRTTRRLRGLLCF